VTYSEPLEIACCPSAMTHDNLFETPQISAHLQFIANGIDCARTVLECIIFNRFGLALSEKQIPRFVGNVSS